MIPYQKPVVLKKSLPSPRGVCRVCGCTFSNPCYHPEHGFCWWADDTHTICSHCADPEIAEDERTEHCVNSKPTSK